APVAAMLMEGAPQNLSVLLSGRLTWPAVAMLLESGTPGFDALIAPGHVATVMGPEQWNFVVDKHHIPAAIAGFNADSLLAAMYSTLRQLNENRRFLDNCYTQLVKPGGNQLAQQHLATVMNVYDANWRGIGIIPQSGYKLDKAFDNHDARKIFPSYADDARKRAGEMPPGCDCAKVVLGKIYPNECTLFGKACVPRNPIGPCMVSDEGACRIWWAGGLRTSANSALNEKAIGE
ncbi:MAG TPA: hydrogenase formation protein HypD, partial [Gammaproteobacteria bacterium]|nr:hydrogenase formation protein HypD [Gammaproteobacteria bacterium]